MDMSSCNILLLLIALLLHITSPTILYVIPDNHYSATNSSYHTLQYYLNHSLTSHTQFHFLQGQHYLYGDLIIHNVTNISLTGVGNVIIDCKGLPAGIIVSNVTQFTMEYLSLLHCNSSITGSRYTNIYTRDGGMVMDTAASLCLHSCRSVIIVNLSITVNIGVDGLLVTNTERNNQIINVTVQVNCTQLNTHCSTNGIALHHFDNGGTDDTSILIENYVHEGKGICANAISHPQCALKILLTQLLYSTSVSIYVVNTTFNGLRNITVLYYYGESSGVDTWSRLTFLHCQIYRNTNNLIPLLHVIIHNAMPFDSKGNNSDCKHSNVITLVHCKLFDNFNTVSLLQIVPINTILINVHIQILSCKFSNNNARFMIEVRSRVNILRQMSHQINTIIDHNEHNRGISILSVNGVVNILNNVVISNNNYFDSALIYLHLSVLNIYGSCKIFGNNVKYISTRSRDSYFLFQDHSVLSIMENTVFITLSTNVFDSEWQQNEIICYFQFANHKGSPDNVVKQKEIAINYTIIFTHNILTDPLYNSKHVQLIDDDCTWLPDTAFVTSTYLS